MSPENPPLISIVIPVYNTSTYLEECLNSVLRQEKVNLEVICVDDKSLDNSLDILKRYQTKDQRIKIIEHEKNLGLPNARNTGVQHAKGKYLIHLDSDDYWVGQNTLYDILSIAEIDQCDVLRFNGKFKINEDETKELTPWSDSINTTLDRNSSLWIFRSVFLYLWRTAFLKKKNISFRKEITIGEDGIFISHALTKTKNISTCSIDLYRYRYSPQSIMQKAWSFDDFFEELKSSQIIENNIEGLNTVLDFYQIHRVLMYFPLRLLPRAGRDLSKYERQCYQFELGKYLKRLRERTSTGFNPTQRLLINFFYLFTQLPSVIFWAFTPNLGFVMNKLKAGIWRFNLFKKRELYQKVKRWGLRRFSSAQFLLKKLLGRQKMSFENIEREKEYNFQLHTKNKKPGMSAMVRVKNEEDNILDCLKSISHLVDEIILIDNGSSDLTLKKAQQLQQESSFGEKIRIFEYPFNVAKCGSEHQETPENSIHNLAYYYNFCLSKCSYSCVIKWDADMRLNFSYQNIPGIRALITRRLKKAGGFRIITTARLAYFQNGIGFWKSHNHFFSEARIFSNTIGTYFAKGSDWEVLRQPKFTQVIKYEPAIAYEIKNVELDEFSHWSETSFLGHRKALEYRASALIAAGKVSRDSKEFEITNELNQQAEH